MFERTQLDANRSREAWQVIRGFYFQTQRTVLAALELAEDEQLELESGEDLAWILPAAGEFGTPAVRVLEQIKHLTRPVTLGSEGARFALLNASELLSQNEKKSFRLRFRFTSTASVGKEAVQPPCLSGRRGIDVWSQVQADKQSPDLLCLAELLRLQKPPAKVKPARWAAAIRHLTGDSATFEKFVRSFEWSLGVEGVPDTQESILLAIQRRGLAASRAEATIVHDRLIAMVFRVLTRREGRTITSDQIRQLLVQPQEADEARIQEWVRAEIVAVMSSVEALEDRVSQLDGRLSASIGVISQRLGIVESAQARFEAIHEKRGAASVLPAPTLEPPPELASAVERRETVDGLLSDPVPWLALYGSHGTGKTQLAIQAISRLGVNAVWLRLRDCPLSDVAPRLRDAMERGSRQQGGVPFVVLDDLPDLAGAEQIADELALSLRMKPAVRGALSTSNFRLPRTLAQSVLGPYIREVAVPSMSLGELDALLASMQAPATSRAGLARIVLAFSDGHATLASHLCAFVRDRSWQITDQTMREIVGRQHLATLEEEVLKKVLDSVGDGARALLYRLRLASGPFRVSTAERLGGVKPIVHYPKEHIARLVGPWLQYEQSDELSVSPLLNAVDVTLAPDEAAECHKILG